MSFNVDTVIAESKREPFPFTLDKKNHTLPHMQTLTAEQLVRMDSGNAVEVLHEIAGDKLGDRLGKLPGYALDALLKEWMAHAGLEPGESEASTGS